MTAPPPAPADESYAARLLDPRVRGYLVTLVAALAVVFVALFQRGQLLAAGFPVALAVPGLLLRWTAMPVVVVAAVCYLLVFPTGIPFDNAAFATIRASYFEVTDLLFVAAVLCYLTAQYRLYGLTVRAVPGDWPAAGRPPAGPETRRPADAITGTELQWLFAGVGAAVLAGQLLWLALTQLDADFTRFPPVTPTSHGVAPGPSRFVLFVAVFGGVAGAARLVFWYWRLHRLNADQARLVLIDTGWAEVRREAARQETWRAWGRPGGRDGDRLSFWAGLRGPALVLVLLASLGFVLGMIWLVLRNL